MSRDKGELTQYRRNGRYRRVLRRKAIAKLGGRCSCGYDDERALVFDHIKPVRRGLHGISRSKESGQDTHRAVLKGSKAYQLLCANCHMIKTRSDDVEGRMSVNWSKRPMLRDRLLLMMNGQAVEEVDTSQLEMFEK
jgi:5-methylcytosine-specific restriction endonuclease McrA